MSEGLGRHAAEPRRRRLSPRFVAGVVFLAVQCGLVAHGRFVDSRDFSWAPHSSQVEYVLRVEIAGRELSPAEAARRYRLREPYGWEAHSYKNLIDVVAQYERTYGRADAARVHLDYRVNGGEPQTWEWEPP